MARPKNPANFSYSGRHLLFLIVLLLFLYVILPRLGNFSASLYALEGAHFGYLAIACAALLTTYGLAASVYWLIAVHPISYRRTLAIQFAAAFAGRLLPGGLGNLALNAQYLRRQYHTTTEAVAIVGTNNLLGVCGHSVLLAFVVLFGGNGLSQALVVPHVPREILVSAALLGGTAVSLIVFKAFRGWARQAMRQLGQYASIYRGRLRRLALGLVCSCSLTSAYVLIFYMLALSLGADLELVQAFIIFTIGMVATAATPTPGGLIGAEAGLTAGLMAYGLDGSLALAIALLYRFLTYWLPLVPGLVIFIWARRLYT